MTEMHQHEDIAAITAQGERVTHLQRDNCYYAHLSLYHFALPFSRSAVVLDAGSGAGYGAAYLAERGARAVRGIDISAEAVAFSRRHFPHPQLQFDVMDLAQITGFPDQHFDLIFSSNALEHLHDVPAFLRSAWRLLKPDGVLIIAVPPITNAYERSLNIANPYHLNIWSPRQWHHTLATYFASIQGYAHGFRQPGVVLDFGRDTEHPNIDQSAFVFAARPLEELAATPTITSVFVARAPCPAADLPPPAAPLSFVDDSFTSALPDKAFQLELQSRIRDLEAQLHSAQQRLHETVSIAAETDRYRARLESTLQRKELHIAQLEALIRRLENGRVMRLLRRFTPKR